MKSKEFFKEYIEVFLKQNSVLNLISKNDEKFLWEKHIFDSLAIEKFFIKYYPHPLRAGKQLCEAERATNAGAGVTLLDIGTGGGFPSVPIALCYPEIEVYALDSIRKKINAIENIKQELNIKNLHTICGRVENLKISPLPLGEGACKAGEGSFAVINADDAYGERFLGVVPEGVRKYTYGVKNKADVMAKDINFSLNGAEFTLTENGNEHKVNLHMNGMFSVYNVLAAVTASLAMGINIEVALKALQNVKGVAGRFEAVVKKPLVIVDYAHTPDGLENVLKSAREITPADGKLICLFGCGGDRDATKRPKMGAIAEKLADKIVITSDNPRSEDPQIIITDIIAGLKSVNTENVIVEADRGTAIALLKTIANNNDVVVIAGKGHEDYQILKDKTIHFDDREEARKVFEGSVI